MKLKKDYLLGSWINTGSAIVSEIMSASGFDFLVVDTEHSAIDIGQTQILFQAIMAGNPECIPMVRLAGNVYSETKRYLDAGAMGVIVPLVNTRNDAELIIESVKYPPHGMRGVGFGRSHGYGFNFDSYMKNSNEKTIVGVQIEHIKGVNNIDEIFSVQGIDFAFIGPYDLTASMRITAQFDHPDYHEVIKKIISKCREYKILPGIHVVQPDTNEAVRRIREGFKIIAYSLDITMLGYSCRKGIIDINLNIK